jgi:hypothetical protein
MPVATQDRLKGGVEKILRAVFGPRIDYLAPYSCVVVAQNGDGTVDIQPDDPRFPGMQHIPIAYGIPGVAATVVSGARCDLVFLAGDPSKPRVTFWEGGSVTKLTITATNVQVNASDVNVSTATAEITCSGNATISAALLTLPNGTLPIARATDPAVCGPFAGTIIGPGNVTVLG